MWLAAAGLRHAELLASERHAALQCRAVRSKLPLGCLKPPEACRRQSAFAGLREK